MRSQIALEVEGSKAVGVDDNSRNIVVSVESESSSVDIACLRYLSNWFVSASNLLESNQNHVYEYNSGSNGYW